MRPNKLLSSFFGHIGIKEEGPKGIGPTFALSFFADGWETVRIDPFTRNLDSDKVANLTVTEIGIGTTNISFLREFVPLDADSCESILFSRDDGEDGQFEISWRV